MYLNIKITSFVFVLFFSSISFALSDVKKESSCEVFSAVRDFLACTLEAHPHLQEIEYEKEEAKGRLEQAGTWPNPNVEFEFKETDKIGLTSQEVGITAMQPVLIGGKISARKKEAKALSNLAKANILKSKEKAVIDSLLHLYRLRQVIEELELIKESLATFNKVKKQYQKRKTLGPEQSVSFDIISLAEADYTMRQSKLESEKGELIRKLTFFIGRDFDVEKDFLPDFKMDWPSLLEDNEIKGGDIQIIQAQKSLAEGKLDIAKSKAWPELAIGPSYSIETENNDRITTIGLSLEMELPLFNINSGNKAAALANQQRAALNEKNETEKLKNLRKNLSEIYTSVTKRLLAINASSLGKAKHKRIHKYLNRGIVSAAMVIESHRQIVEFQEHVNEQELQALSALWQVRALDGTLLTKVNEIKITN